MSLPVAGIDGTMRNRLKAGPATGWARLKTGTLRNVVALAGVVPGPPPQRRPQIFVAIVNHDHAPKARPALDALVDWVARGMPAE
jgi:D-alanyl-D-alanine carboxypeptidase/D-alanyl-D-alanine-endopeptidase (penicillin-binding protein 4)